MSFQLLRALKLIMLCLKRFLVCLDLGFVLCHRFHYRKFTGNINPSFKNVNDIETLKTLGFFVSFVLSSSLNNCLIRSLKCWERNIQLKEIKACKYLYRVNRKVFTYFPLENCWLDLHYQNNVIKTCFSGTPAFLQPNL